MRISEKPLFPKHGPRSLLFRIPLSVGLVWMNFSLLVKENINEELDSSIECLFYSLFQINGVKPPNFLLNSV
jgi:hypothetical protein